MNNKFESSIERESRLAIEHVFKNDLRIQGRKIINVRNIPYILGDKLDRKEKNGFTYYNANRVLINQIQCPKIIVKDKNTKLLRFKKEDTEKNNIQYPWIRVVKTSHTDIVANIGDLWAYGNSIEEVRAFLSVAVYDVCLAHNHNMVKNAIFKHQIKMKS